MTATDASRPISPHGHAPIFMIPGIVFSLSLSLVMSTPADLEFTDLSDLTELSSDDQAGPSVTKHSNGKQSAKDSFILKNTLRPPRSVSYTTKWLHGGMNLRLSNQSPKPVFLSDQLTLQHIDLDPEYQVLSTLEPTDSFLIVPQQRDVVWPESKQMGLIDSIFHNFYIPPIIFCECESRSSPSITQAISNMLGVRSEEDGTEKRTCIDGKQRLTSIHR